MALIPSQVLRVAILLSYLSILCNFKALDIPAHQTYGGSWKFLTFIDLIKGLCIHISSRSLEKDYRNCQSLQHSLWRHPDQSDSTCLV
ncbi:androgen-induced gene 1 protein isoform X4 [Chiloscyllium plagiosum]|uniref:androgen-induced gene 1 protein isoform X4 n=1 Tax=Chiloscyllium plagiosum TaxID=36176 RepID=UPI001CB82559|nr:androgen-induced gene 1 protein isoform X4 [Chiloscyllium plagiosum]